MADRPVVTTPDLTLFVDQRFFIEPLGGPQDPKNYLDRFPEEVYNKSPESRFTRFMYALLGPAGGGWLRKNYLEARLLLEDSGVELGDLEAFYGDPLRFGRILEEVYDEDPHGLLSRADWDKLRAKDARYRNRALDYVNGARMGNTPEGMRLVARSGLGHEVEIVENYKYLYDQHSDDPVGIPYFGVTYSTEEMIVIPRRELTQSEIQTLDFYGDPTGGTFILGFDGQETAALAYNITIENIQVALEALPNIGIGQVAVEGGPLPDEPVLIRFTGTLAYKDVPKVYVIPSLTGGTNPGASVVTTQSGVDSQDEVAYISPRDRYYLQVALDRIKAVTTIVSPGHGTGIQSLTDWNSVVSSSEYNEVIRFVTGSTSVVWPTPDDIYWIEAGLERESKRVFRDLQHHYQGFHRVVSVDASSSLIGSASQYQRIVTPVLGAKHPDYEFSPHRALARTYEPINVTTTTGDNRPTQFVNGVYPIEYKALPGVAPTDFVDDKFWASNEFTTGAEYLELDLGAVCAINQITFETTKKPFDINVTFDVRDSDDDPLWTPVVLSDEFPSTTSIAFIAAENPWEQCEINFVNGSGGLVYARRLRIYFTRRNDAGSPFNTGTEQIPYSIEVRNLRVLRNVV